MTSRTVVILATGILLAGIWFFTSGKNLLVPEKQDAPLKCARPECGVDFTAKLSIPYSRWPVKCPKCGEKSGYPRSACRKCGATYPIMMPVPLEKCPKCGAPLPH